MKNAFAISWFFLFFSLSAQALERIVYEEEFTPVIVARMEDSSEFVQMLDALSRLFGKTLTPADLYEAIEEESRGDRLISEWLGEIESGKEAISPRLIMAAFVSFADEISEKHCLRVVPTLELFFGSSSFISPEVVAFLNRLPADAPSQILNVGPGHGFLEMMVFGNSRWRNQKVDSVEYSRALVKLFQKSTLPYLARFDRSRGTDFRFVEGDILTGLPTAFRSMKYAAVTALNVIHFFHPRMWAVFFRTVFDSLEEGGSFLLSTRDILGSSMPDRLQVYREQAAAGSPFLGFQKVTERTDREGLKSIEVVGLSEEDTLPIGMTQVGSGEGSVLTRTSIKGGFEADDFCRLVGAVTRSTFTVETCQSDGLNIFVVLRKFRMGSSSQ